MESDRFSGEREEEPTVTIAVTQKERNLLRTLVQGALSDEGEKWVGGPNMEPAKSNQLQQLLAKL